MSAGARIAYQKIDASAHDLDVATIEAHRA